MATLYAVVNGLATDATPDSGADYVMTVDASASTLKKVLLSAIGGSGGAVSPSICDGRLTLTSGTAVTITDVTAATNVYFTPFGGNQVALYDGVSAWAYHTLTEKTLSLSGLAADTNYDVFVYDSLGLTLEAVAWTDGTTRATALVLQDGVYVKSGATTRRYLGTFRTTATIGQTEDSLEKRYLWNVNQRKPRAVRRIEATNSWTYASASYQSANASTANRIGVVVGLAEDAIEVSVHAHVIQSNTQIGAVGIGLDSTSTNSAIVSGVSSGPVGGQRHQISARYVGVPGLGFHYLQWLEYAVAGTVTFEGDNGVTYEQSGMTGMVYA